MNYNEICGFTPHFGREHRDFIKIMIKCEEFKQYWIQPNQFFFPNQTLVIIVKSRPRDGETKSQLLISIHPQNKPREEDSIGVLTIPQDLYKKQLERLNKRIG